jgi:hypothetical protein
MMTSPITDVSKRVFVNYFYCNETVLSCQQREQKKVGLHSPDIILHLKIRVPWSPCRDSLCCVKQGAVAPRNATTGGRAAP